MFEVNLRPLLLQPPLKGKTVLGLDPAYRTGCKIAVIDPEGNVLDTAVVYPTPPQNRTEEAEAKLLALIEKYGVEVISIGNGTASKELSREPKLKTLAGLKSRPKLFHKMTIAS